MAASSPQTEYTKEVRFAVVMYGGVSLAIYINGIAQELLRLVRSTARGGKITPVSGTERLYRKVSYLLDDGVDGLARYEADAGEQDSVPPTRFLVDILSGTSAGGINGIFLAKALSNGQDMEQLKDLWVQEGDIDRLINDKRSVETPLSLQDPPTSLLNSERMYLELLKAFEGMDKAGGPRDVKQLSPFVDELDLFITSTDLQGVVLPIRLSDDLVYERRHRNVLHFVYSSPAMSGESEPRNDFLARYNPFLAYAARCTSSFPFAFEPMCLCDTDGILDKLPGYNSNIDSKSGSELWQKFYKDYLDPRGLSTIPFPKRAFGDGGYLDNKPFSYATETLMNRNADVPVDRKLIYIEPSPEHPEDDVEREEKPDAIDNVISALLTLPRYETIREDLERVKERNRLIDRVNNITEGVDRDEEKVKPAIEHDTYANSYEEWLRRGALASPPVADLWAQEVLTDEQVGTLDLADMIKRKGRAYAAYHRLRISSVTDDLARLITRVAGFDENSDYFIVVRSMVRAWRIRTYIEYRQDPGDPHPTMNRFLFDFDLSYPIRRVNYLRKKADSLYRLDKDTLDLIKAKSSAFALGDNVGTLREDEKVIFRHELLRAKETLSDIFVSLRRSARSVRSRRTTKTSGAGSPAGVSPVQKQVQKLMVVIEQRVRMLIRNKETRSALLDYFLGKRDFEGADKAERERSYATETPEEECTNRALRFLDNNPDLLTLLNETAEFLKANLRPAKDDAEQRSLELFGTKNTNSISSDPVTDNVAWVARNSLGYYYQKYEDYDQLTYPILYNTDVGEADTVDIIRVSPEDAKQLINERETGCHKLAGTALGHFGAFLQKLWRQNDILWGRLDAAERIITSLLPNHPLRTQLIGEAQAEIICETMEAMGEDERHELLAESLMRTRTRKVEPDLLSTFIENLQLNAGSNPQLTAKLNALIDPKKLRQFYVTNFRTRSRAEPETALRSAARATTVVGKMLEALSSSRRVNTKYALWIARLGQIFWAMVEVAVPQSFPNLFFRHWLKLVYFLEALLIAGSTLLLHKEVQQFALTAFGITAAVHLAVVILGDLIQSRNRWANLVKAAAGVLLFALIVLGGLALSAVLGFEFAWKWISRAREWFIAAPPIGLNVHSFLRLGLVLSVFLVFFWSIRKDLKGFFTGAD